MHRVNRNFTIINIIAAIVMLAFCVLLEIDTKGKWWGKIMIIFGVFEGILLIAGVLYMRSQIIKVGGVFVKEKLIIVHLINFIVWAIFYIAQNLQALNMESTTKGMSKKERWNNVSWLTMAFYAEIIGLVGYLIQKYMDLFLLYLISQFSLKKEEQQILDKVLNRKVPAMVYLQN